ncbi:serine/threonine-protein kinase RsbW [Litoreibacter ponti]|uniref:Serine/threonine-protein kinase RsbW n=1 Tax=Litoreibacter ponti TaxID=1510457 RepID=A0A2T6BNN4_9RHOB|nr:ATP-binding protein [Litoreibacter ponti]PTX57689.1 serine/threonine-protein kinase RsbW [Litoreibacter ponti]
MSNVARYSFMSSPPRLHFEESINADPFAIRDTIIEIMRCLQTEFPAQSEGIISTEIVLAEVMNNIAEHSYQGTNLGSLSISVLCTDDMISIETRDYGIPMPGLTPPELDQPDLPEEMNDLPEGGFGWFFIRSLSSHMEYRRIGSQNIFCAQIRTRGKNEGDEDPANIAF